MGGALSKRNIQKKKKNNKNQLLEFYKKSSVPNLKKIRPAIQAAEMCTDGRTDGQTELRDPLFWSSPSS